MNKVIFLPSPIEYSDSDQPAGSDGEAHPDEFSSWGSDLHDESRTISEYEEVFRTSEVKDVKHTAGSKIASTKNEFEAEQYKFKHNDKIEQKVALEGDSKLLNKGLKVFNSLNKNFLNSEFAETFNNEAESTAASVIESETSREPCNRTFETQTDKESAEISEVQKEITSEGGKLEINGCKVIFPKDAVNEPIKVTIYLSLDISQWPQGMTAVSPMMRCRSSGTTTFKRPIEIELTTWLSSGGGSEVSIMKFSNKKKRKQSEAKWIEEVKVFPNEEGKILFKVDHFCKNVAAIARDDLGAKVRITPFLYHKDDKHFVSVFCRRCETSERKLRKEFFGYDKPLPLMNEINARRSDVISFNLYSKDRAIMKFEEGKQSVKVDDLMTMDMHVGYFTPVKDVKKQKIKFIYVIKINKGEQVHLKKFFIIDWLYPKPTHSQDVIIVKPQVGRDVHCHGKGNTVIEKRVMQSDSDA